MEVKDSKDLDFAQVKKRQDIYAEKQATKIWQEVPSNTNPYISKASLCHGYDLLELMDKKSFIDVVYLLFRGELPSKNEKQLLDKVFIAFINPGPRHPSTRAAIDAGIGKTDSELILPIGLSLLSGESSGASEVESAMRWLRKNRKHEPTLIAKNILTLKQESKSEGLSKAAIAPGFGSHLGGVDELVESIAEEINKLPGAGNVFLWANRFAAALKSHDAGWLSTGLVAAILCDLGFQPRMGAGLFQIMSAPGIFAHAIEVANKPITAMPFVDDEEYIMEFNEEVVDV